MFNSRISSKPFGNGAVFVIEQEFVYLRKSGRRWIVAGYPRPGWLAFLQGGLSLIMDDIGNGRFTIVYICNCEDNIATLKYQFNIVLW